jgi:hypothetical protein
LVGNDGRQLLHQFEDGHYEEGDRGEEKTGGGRKREPKREGESAGQHVERKESVDKPTGVRGGARGGGERGSLSFFSLLRCDSGINA